MLDRDTLDAGASRGVVERLQAAGIPVVPVSVMSLDEIAPIAATLGLRDPMIIEGGAIARWVDGRWDVEPCGPPADTLLDVVGEIEDRTGASLLISSDPQASRHYFSEPIIIESGEDEAIIRTAADLGFSVRRGTRSLHFCRTCDEGEAVARVRNELRPEVAVAIGSSPLDVDFLSRADISMIVTGPSEWAAAVEETWCRLQSAASRTFA